MPSSWFREFVTGMTAITCLMIAVLFGSYILRNWRLHRLDQCGWLRDCSPAIAITIYMIGATIVNGVMWWARHLYNADIDLDAYESLTTTLICVGLAIKVGGGLWIIREFTPRFLGEWPWVITAMISFAFGSLIAFNII